MNRAVASILLICKAGDPAACALGREIRDWLDAGGVRAALAENLRDAPRRFEDGQKPDLILVLGGDGTMLSEARKPEAAGLPMLGLNLGRVGFLTSLNRDDWRQALTEILERGFAAAPWMMLDVTVLRQGRTVFATRAVNDVVVSRGAVARLIELDVEYGGEPVCRVRADGVVVSTPTGSTAYCVSAGGPLMHPALNVMCLTPVCPFLNDARPIVVPADRPLLLRAADHEEMFLTADGQEIFALRQNDAVRAIRAEVGFNLVRRPGDSYFQRLRRKGFVKDQ